MMSHQRLVILSVLALLHAGCGPPVNRAQLVQEALKADPDFSWTLTRHRTLANRIETYERELALKRDTIEQNIAQLRKDLSTASENVKRKIAEVKRQIEPDRKRLELALTSANEQLRGMRFQRASIGRSIVQWRKADKANQAGWTPAERTQQRLRLTDMLHDAERLDQELNALKAHVRLLKIKLLLIKL